jgi:hypothetical protein
VSGFAVTAVCAEGVAGDLTVLLDQMQKIRLPGFDEMRKMVQRIACEKVIDERGVPMTCAEAVLRSWARSEEPALLRAFVEYAYGKVPDKLETNPLENKTTLILHYGHEQKNEMISAGCF